MAFFPLVGLLIGFIVAFFDWASLEIWTPGIRGVLDCMILAGITRGLHLDGLSDTADGLLSSRPREEALMIMKDSSTGALGAVTLIMVLMLKASCLAQISKGQIIQWIVLIPTLSRYSLVLLASMSDYARKEGGLGQLFVGKSARAALFLALPTAAAASWLFCGIQGMVAFLIASLLSIFSWRFFKRKLGGVTGDCLGAHLEVTETALLLYAATF